MTATRTQNDRAARARAAAIGWGSGDEPTRVRWGRVITGVTGVLLCGFVFAAAYQQATAGRDVVTLARDVHRFDVLTADDLQVSSVSTGDDVPTISGEKLESLVGRAARVDLIQGSLLSEAQLLGAGERPVADDEAVVGTLLASADSPDTLPLGARVEIIVRPAAGTSSGSSSIDGWILEVGERESTTGGSRKVSLVVPAGEAQAVSAAAAEKRVSVVVRGG